MLSKYELTCSEQEALNTEIRYIVASAKVNNEDLIKLTLPEGYSEKQARSVIFTVSKILRDMKQNDLIQFFEDRNGYKRGSMRWSFLLNKYSEELEGDFDAPDYVYVKL